MAKRNPYKAGGMFEGASRLIFGNATQLRRNMRDAETVLWMYLKNGVNGCKIHRQHPIGLYIADFYCHKAKLIIELDGTIHDKPEVKENDDARQKELERCGYVISRFTNQQVLKKTEEVIKIITEQIKFLTDSEKQNTLG
jgi:cyclase